MSPEIRQMKGRKMQSERVFRNVKKIGLKKMGRTKLTI